MLSLRLRSLAANFRKVSRGPGLRFRDQDAGFLMQEKGRGLLTESVER